MCVWDTTLLSMVSGDIPRIHRCLSLQHDNLDDEDEHSKRVSRNGRLSVHGHITPNQKGHCAMLLHSSIFSNFIWQSTIFCQGKSRIDMGVVQNSGITNDHTGYPEVMIWLHVTGGSPNGAFGYHCLHVYRQYTKCGYVRLYIYRYHWNQIW